MAVGRPPLAAVVDLGQQPGGLLEAALDHVVVSRGWA
jgi:hypothetical protein